MAQDTSKRRVSGLVIIVLQPLNVVVVTWLPVAASSCRYASSWCGGDMAVVRSLGLRRHPAVVAGVLLLYIGPIGSE
jgi:hypothetical protein